MMNYVHKSLAAPDTPIPVGLAGCGGTGSQILSGLARLNRALVSLNHPGLDVTVYDPDRVSEANIGRQLFSPADIGRYKAEALVTRVNQFMGFSWKAAPVRYGVDSGKGERYDLLITAIDTAQTRLKIAGKVRRQPCYWLDTGNTRRTGQVILGNSISFPQPDSASNAIGKLPMVTELYNLKRVKEDAQGPSCSLEAALEQQERKAAGAKNGVDNHISEREFKEFPADCIIYNNRTLNVLFSAVDDVIADVLPADTMKRSAGYDQGN